MSSKLSLQTNDFKFFAESKDSTSKQLGKAISKIIEPKIDFVPASILVNDEKMMGKARSFVDKKIKKSNPNATTEWSGSFVVIKLNGNIVDRSEIHGATVDNEKKEVLQVQIDLKSIQQKSFR